MLEAIEAKCAEMDWDMPTTSWPRFVDYIWQNGKKKGKEFVKLFCNLFVNTTDPSDHIRREVIVAEVDWEEGTKAGPIVDDLFAAVAGSTFVPHSVQVCTSSLHVSLRVYHMNLSRFCAQFVLYDVISLRPI